MRLSLAAVAASAASANAFRDTSPFVLFSSAALPTKDVSTHQLQSAPAVLSATKSLLASCPSDIYLVLAQPSILSAELSASSSPHLAAAVGAPSVGTKFSVSGVVGATISDGGEVVDWLVSECGAERVALGDWEGGSGKGKERMVVNGVLPAIGAAGVERKKVVSDNDAKIFSLLKKLEGQKYTVIYHSSPADVVAEKDTTEQQIVYEAQFEEVMHMGLKRALDGRERNATAGADTRPLFEKYQFWSPGLFMGLLVSLLLVSILWVGISAIASLEVSYGAFDKEMGPAAQKKQ